VSRRPHSLLPTFLELPRRCATRGQAAGRPKLCRRTFSLAVQRACARVVAVAPLPGRRDWSSGVGPSRHGELGDSQHFSQEHSQQCSQTSSWDGFFASTITRKGLRAPAAHSNTHSTSHSNTHSNTHRARSQPWELTDSAWALPVRRPARSARCALFQAEYGEQRAVDRFHVAGYERAQESGQEPTLENEEPTEGSEPPTACGALPSARGSPPHRESEAGQEAVLRPDRTIRLCHVREDEPAGLITRQASARSRAVLAPCASGVLPGRPLL
jgi:hypothetical protein